jgi:MFS family permease
MIPPSWGIERHTQASTYKEIFGLPAFRSFWIGFTFSGLGDAMTRTVLVWMVYTLTGSSEALGLLLVSYTAPVIIGGILAGSLLDRFNRKAVIIADNIIRGVAVAMIPTLSFLGLLSLWEIYAVAAVYGFFFMITLAGGPSIIPDLVPERGLSAANSLETLSFTLSGVVGPPVAGILIPITGAPNVIIVDAVSYAVFALLMTKVSLPTKAVVRGSGLPEEPDYHLKDALRLFVSNKVLLSTTLMFMAFNVGGGFISVWLPVLVVQDLGGGSALYGGILGLSAIGEVVGAVLGGSVAVSRLSLGRLICIAQFLSGVSLVPILVSTNAWTAGLSLFLLGAFSSPLTIWAQTLRMKVIPPRMRGRTFALLRTMMQGASPSGSATAGFLISGLGMATVIAVSAGLTGLPGLAGLGSGALAKDPSKEAQV